MNFLRLFTYVMFTRHAAQKLLAQVVTFNLFYRIYHHLRYDQVLLSQLEAFSLADYNNKH